MASANPSADTPQAEAPTGLASSLAGELRVVIGQLKRRLREEASVGDLTWSQIRVISRLEREGPATVSALARAEGIRSQSMGEVVSVLKALGFVTGAPDPEDGRQTVLSLTDTCIRTIRANRAAREDWLFHSIRAHLEPDEQQQLAAAVGLLKRLLEA